MARPGFHIAILLLLATAVGYAEDWHPALAVAADFRLHLGALGVGFGLVAALLGAWRVVVAAGLVALAAAIGLGPVYDSVEQPGAGHRLRLLYGNLSDRNPTPDALVRTLRAVDADILITAETSRTVGEALTAAYPHRLVAAGPGEARRTAIWSKHPLAQGSLYLNNTVAPTGAAATAELGGGLRLGLIGGHFSRPFERLHMIQAAALGPIAAGLARPLVVAGDFNAAPWTRVVAHAAEVTGTRVLGGYRVTWKGSYPTPLGPLPEPWGQQIDQILLSREIGVESVEALTLPGSDHRGLLLLLRIPAP